MLFFIIMQSFIKTLCQCCKCLILKWQAFQLVVGLNEKSGVRGGGQERLFCFLNTSSALNYNRINKNCPNWLFPAFFPLFCMAVAFDSYWEQILTLDCDILTGILTGSNLLFEVLRRSAFICKKLYEVLQSFMPVRQKNKCEPSYCLPYLLVNLLLKTFWFGFFTVCTTVLLYSIVLLPVLRYRSINQFGIWTL